MTVPARLALRAAERPDGLAHEVIGRGCLRLGEWDGRSNAVAHELLARGVRRGDRVVLSCSPRAWLDYAVEYVGVQKAGAVAVPVLDQYGRQHLTRIVAEAGAVGVIGGSSAPDGAWWSDHGSLQRDRPATTPAVSVRPDDDAEILFTSGTTGRPKGVVATHSGVLFTHSTSSRDVRARRVLHALPPGSLAGQGLLLQPLDATPHQTFTLPEFTARDFLAAIQRHRVTDVVLVPAFVGLLVKLPERDAFDLSSVARVRTMSAPIAPALLRKLDRLFESAAIMNMYTSTEAWPARTRMRYDPARPDSVGRAVGAGSIRIVDHDGAVATPGTRGSVELALAGAPRRRYLGDPDATAEVFRPDGWVRTGDVGYLDSDGYLYLVDRESDLVISGGVNISTIEVEAAIREYPEVVDVATLGMPHEVLGEYLLAAVTVTQSFSASVFSEFLEERLGSIKAPKRVVVVDAIPRNAMRKVQKAELRKRLTREGGHGRADAAEPDLCAQVRRFWSDALGEELADPGLGFVELGGTSLGAMEIVGRVRSELGRVIRQRDVFAAASLHDFCRTVGAAPATSEDRPRQTGDVAHRDGAAPAYGHPHESRRTYPSSYSQRWFFHAHRGAWSSINIPVLFWLDDGYDLAALEAALDDLLQRHEALRTTLKRGAHGLLQQVHDRGNMPLEIFDGQGDESPTGTGHGLRAVQDAIYEPFYLHGGRLVRARVCRVDRGDVLVLSAHHTVSDGWSSGIIYRDLVELYRARRDQRSPRLPPLDAQGADYARWEHELATSGRLEYWRQRLTTTRPRLRLDLSTGRADRPVRMTGWSQPLAPSIVEDINLAARTLRTSQARVLGAAVIASLTEHIEQSVTVGLVTANRSRPEFANVVGNLADFLPVRVDVSRGPSFAELVALFDRAVAEANEHYVPFGALTEIIDDGRGPESRPPMDVAVNYLPRPRQAAKPTRREPSLRRLFEDEDFAGRIEGQPLVMERKDLRSDIDYTFYSRADGALRVAIFADRSTVAETQVSRLGEGLLETLRRMSRRA